MRPVFVLIHRYVGLLMVPFLIVTGLTGAIISWDHELDDLLNPHLMKAPGRGPAISSLQLARDIEARDPRVRVGFIPLATEPGESLPFGVQPRVDPATGKLFSPGYNQLFIDPATGAELGRREWGATWPITRENLVSFLYVLHFSLHLPEFMGSDRWGIRLLGVIAILWIIDCFTGVYLRPNAGTYKLHYDLHRASSLWAWGLLFVLAFTAFSLNLYREVFYPMMSSFSQVTPTPFDTRTPTGPLHPIEPRVSFAEIVELARSEARRRHWDEPPGSIFYAAEFGIYGVQFFHPGVDHGTAGVGPARLFFDGQDGRLIGERLPWKGTVADIFVQAQFPLHSGRILGLPGRIAISLMGVVGAMLSVTGTYVWWRKRRGRRHAIRQPPTHPET